MEHTREEKAFEETKIKNSKCFLSGMRKPDNYFCALKHMKEKSMEGK